MKVQIITVSDKASMGKRTDTAGPAVKKILKKNDYLVNDIVIVADEEEQIIRELAKAINNNVNLILTVGGTGFSKRDVTPNATLKVIEKETRGISELIRSEGYKITPRAALSCAVSGIKDNSLIINLPGSLKAATENLEIVLPILVHGLKTLIGEDSECG